MNDDLINNDLWNQSRKEQESDVLRDAVHLRQQLDTLIGMLQDSEVPDFMQIMKLNVYMTRTTRQFDIYMYLCEKERLDNDKQKARSSD